MKRIRLAGLALAGVLLMCAATTAAGASASTSQVSAFGAGGLGQLGDESTHNSIDTPVPVVTEPKTPLGEPIAVADGGYHALAVVHGGKVYAWGDNASGQLGLGTEKGPEECSSTPCSTRARQVPELSGVTAVAGGREHSLALLESGSVFAWGRNSAGQLGDGNTTNSDKPVEVRGLTAKVKAIAAGCEFSIALLETGHVETWGAGGRGQLGNGGTANSDTAEEVPGLSGVKAIAAGCEFGIALLESGHVEEWGANSYGQLGDGTTTDKHSPTEVAELTEATAIAGGGEFSLALVKGGHVKAWGANYVGQLGDETLTGPEKCLFFSACSTRPVSVSISAEVSAIAAGEYHALALRGGNIDLWGNYGGVAKKSDAKPSKLGLIYNVQAIAAGGNSNVTIGPAVPAVRTVSPASGTSAGGTTVEITGFNFAEVSSVIFGGTPATKFEVNAEGTVITAVTPTHTPGKVGVQVCGAGGCEKGEFIFLTTGNPQFGRCLSATGGEYNDNACSELGGAHAYEWHPGATTKFTFSGNNATFESASGTKISCVDVAKTPEASGTGEIDGTSEVELNLKFTNCELVGSAVKCTSPGASGEGELLTSQLTGIIGFENKELSKVGVSLSPAEEGEPVLEATCGEHEVVITGAVIAGYSPVNTMTTKFHLGFRAKKGGKQNPEKLEGFEKEVLSMSLDGGPSSQTSLAIEETSVITEQTIELNTFVV